MTPVAVSVGQLAAAILTGMILGIVYELLRPLRPRLTVLSDGLFVTALLYGWLYLVFGICDGDIRMIQTAGLLLGAWTFRMTLGKLLEVLIHRLVHPITVFCKKIWKFFKKLFASGRKSVTIKWTIRRRSRRSPGGSTHGKVQKSI